MKHPMQNIQIINDLPRFVENRIVTFLLNNGGYDLNTLSTLEFSDEDWTQFAQLIGYSLGGFSQLSYVSDEDYERAVRMANEVEMREGLKKAVFGQEGGC